MRKFQSSGEIESAHEFEVSFWRETLSLEKYVDVFYDERTYSMESQLDIIAFISIIEVWKVDFP